MKNIMLAAVALLLSVSVVRAQSLEEYQKQQLLLLDESELLVETAQVIGQIPVEASGALIPLFPGPRVETADPTAEQLAAILAEREAYWTQRKAAIRSDSYEFRASTGMAEREARLVDEILADVAADKAALAAKTFGQPMIDRKARLIVDWLEFLRFKRDALQGLEPLDTGKAPTQPKRAWYKPKS